MEKIKEIKRIEKETQIKIYNEMVFNKVMKKGEYE